MAAVNPGSAREIVPVNRSRKTAEAVATDLRYGRAPLTRKVEITDGDYDALRGAAVVMICFIGGSERGRLCRRPQLIRAL